MYKRILAAVTMLSFSQMALADVDRAEIFQCMKKSTMSVKENCMMKTIAKHTKHDDFFTRLALQPMKSKQDAFATVTRFPEKKLIVVKSLEPKPKVLIAAR